MIAQEGEFVMENAGTNHAGIDGSGRRLWPGDVIHDLLDAVAEDGDQGSRMRRMGGAERLIHDLTVVIEEGPAILSDEATLREMVIRRADAIVGDIARQIVPAIADRLIREGFPAIAERMIREEIDKLTGEEERMA